MVCIRCGGDMIGDGYTYVLHCEFACSTDYEFHAPDEGPVYCTFEEED